MPTYISHMVSAMETVGLLLWNTSNVTHTVEYQQCYPYRRTFNTTQNSQGDWFLPTSKYRTWTTVWKRRHILAAVQWSPSTSICKISITTDVAQTQMQRIMHHDGFSPHHLQRVWNLYWEIMPTIYDFLNDSNYGYKLRLIYCLQMRLNLPRMVTPTEGTHT